MVQAYVPHEGDLWGAMRDAVVAFLHDVEAESEVPELDASGHGFLLRLSQQEPPPGAVRLIGASLAIAETLGDASARCTRSWPPPTRPTRPWRRAR